MPTTVDQFVQSLSNSGLLTAEEIRALHDSQSGDRLLSDAQELARSLVRDRKLTKFQAVAVYQGKIKGLIVGDYVLLDKIGSGGVGQVFKAQHRKMKRVVALKLLRPTATQNAAAIRRFQREVETAAKLNHPNIVTAHDAGEAEGVQYLVMSYIDGRDLDSRVKESGPLPVPQAVDCLVQAALGLDYAHRQGVVHRDIKPSNLLMDNDGHVTILDLGLAGLHDSEGTSDPGDGRLTLPGQMMGTVNYVSPEQSNDARSADARSDVYSLGCTLFYLLNGRPPYMTDNSAMTLMAHCEASIPSLCDFRQDVSAELNAVFQKMLAKRPEDRYQSMRDLLVALQACGLVAEGRQIPAAAKASPQLQMATNPPSAVIDYELNATHADGERGADDPTSYTLPEGLDERFGTGGLSGRDMTINDRTLQETGTGPAADITSSPVVAAAGRSRTALPTDMTVEFTVAPDAEEIETPLAVRLDQTAMLPPDASVVEADRSAAPVAPAPDAGTLAAGARAVSTQGTAGQGAAPAVAATPAIETAKRSREMLTGVIVGLVVGAVAIGAAVIGFLLSRG